MRHRVLDHPILGYFVLAVFAVVVASLFGILDEVIAPLIPGYAVTTVYAAGEQISHASGVMTALGGLAAAWIYKRHFKPDFQGCFVKSMFAAGISFAALFTILHVAGSVVSICTFGAGSIFIALLRAMAPGFSEEVAFRGLGISNYMRTIRDEKKIPVILWLSAIVFGLFHVANALSGADLGISIIQAVYACGVGVLFGAIYLRTGNLWPTVISHMIVDFAEFCRLDLAESGGLMVNLGVGDWITLVVGTAAAVLGLYLVRKEKYPEIMQIWKERWNKID